MFDGKFATTFNGVNDQGDIVGFYVNSKGNTIGLLARPTPADNAFQDFMVPAWAEGWGAQHHTGHS